MPYTATVDVDDVPIGHRLKGSSRAEQRSYHGNAFKFSFTLSRAALDKEGKVVDFSAARELLGGWLHEHWGHAMLLEFDDPLLDAMKATGSKVCVMACPPTVEHLARLAFEAAAQLLKPLGAEVLHVSCYETPTSRAGYAR